MRILKKLLIMFLLLHLIPNFSVSIFIRLRNYIFRLMNVHGVIECKRGNDVRQAEIYVAEPHVSQPSAFEIELKIEKLKVTNHRVWIKFEKN